MTRVGPWPQNMGRTGPRLGVSFLESTLAPNTFGHPTTMLWAISIVASESVYKPYDDMFF